MRAIKKIFYGICILMMLLCGLIVVCALQPSLTQTIAGVLYGGGITAGAEVQQADTIILDRDQTDDDAGQGDGSGTSETATEDGILVRDNGYQPPEQEDLRLPEQVADKAGYQPIQEQAEEVAGDEAENLQSSLSTGSTGSDLSFDTNLYPYYGMLDANLQQIYKQIYANASNLQRSFAPAVTVSVNQLKNVFEAVCNDHPELFWLETGYSCKYRQDGGCVEINLEFNRLASDITTARNAFQTQAQNLLSGAQNLGSDYEKEKYIHDALLTRVEYNTSAELNQSAYSALVNGQSVCAGYARAFQYLMQQLGIPCYYCTGYSGENHAWNIIGLRGEYYNVDATWDDTNPSTYDYFNRTDADYASTHVRQGLSVYLPACNGTALRGLESGQPQTVSGITTGTVDNTQTPTTSDAPETSTAPTATPLPGPLTWTPSGNTSDNNNPVESTTTDALTAAGYSAEDVQTTMESYYADCLEQMVSVGSGQRQFTSIIPASLWSAVEQAYSSGTYQTGYVNTALERLGMSHFAIQLQAESLTTDYYLLYHNISTWN